MVIVAVEVRLSESERDSGGMIIEPWCTALYTLAEEGLGPSALV